MSRLVQPPFYDAQNAHSYLRGMSDVSVAAGTAAHVLRRNCVWFVSFSGSMTRGRGLKGKWAEPPVLAPSVSDRKHMLGQLLVPKIN